MYTPKPYTRLIHIYETVTSILQKLQINQAHPVGDAISINDLGNSGGCEIFYIYFGVRETQCNKRQVRPCSGMDSLYCRKVSMKLHSSHCKAYIPVSELNQIQHCSMGITSNFAEFF